MIMGEIAPNQLVWPGDRDENKPALVERCRFPLINTSWLSAGDSNSSSTSKSTTPDHVVPSDKGLVPAHIRHRSATSSSSSSPQTDGSLSFRRHLGSDESRSSSSIPCDDVSEPSSSPQLSSPHIPSAQCRPYTAAASRGISLQRGSRPITSSAPRKKKPQRTTTSYKRRVSKKFPAPVMPAAVKKHGQDEQGDNSDGDYVIRCICGFTDILGDQVQCDICEVWQHFGCMGIMPDAVPDTYVCELCDPIVKRPLRAEEAREFHRVMLMADAQTDSKQTGKSTKGRRGKRKKSIEAPVEDNAPANPPRVNDLIVSDNRKRTASTSSIMSNPPTETTPADSTATLSSATKHRMEELSRDDRKILQYEEMFKRMDERKDKREKRKRNPEGSSNGSPPRESGNESHHSENTNPPMSPLPPPLPAPLKVSELSPPVIVETEDSFAAPLQITPARVKVRKTKATKVAELESTDKARYSLRLRNCAATKAATADVPTSSSVDDTSRIELNCVKKRKEKEEGDVGLVDEETPGMVSSSLLKRRSRTVSLIDNYYSAMAEIQTETEPQKASRRNRAYSVSQEWERLKVEQERSRLYRMYGLKKAVYTRYEERSCGKAPSRTLPPSKWSAGNGGYRKYPLNFCRLPTTETPENAGSPSTSKSPNSGSPVAAVKRLKTVRAMIEESVLKNGEMDRAYRTSQAFATRRYPAELQKGAQDPLEGSRSEPVTDVSRDGASARMSGVVEESRQLEPIKVHEAPAAVVAPAAPPVTTQSPPLSFSGSSVRDEPSVVNHQSQPSSEKDKIAGSEFSGIAIVPTKLSLSEYKQRKLQSQRSSESLLDYPMTPLVNSIPPKISSPPKDTPVITSKYPTPPAAQHPGAPPQRSSVIQRIGSVNNTANKLLQENPHPATGAAPGAGHQASGPRGKSANIPQNFDTGSTAAVKVPTSVLSTSASLVGQAPPVGDVNVHVHKVCGRMDASGSKKPFLNPRDNHHMSSNFRPPPQMARSSSKDLKT